MCFAVAVAIAAAAAVIAAVVALVYTTRKIKDTRAPAAGGTCAAPVSLVGGAKDQPIPPIIHQVWVGGAENIPAVYHEYAKTWRAKNPGMTLMQHTDDNEALRFVREHYPEFLGLYRARSRPVERADLLRYMHIHHSGGFYADMDTSCRRSIEPLREHDCVIGPERPGRGSPYLQWFFGASPGHPLMLEVLREAARRHRSGSWRKMNVDEQVLHVTGPKAFTAAVRRCTEEHPSRKIRVEKPGVLGMYNIHWLPKPIQDKAYLVHHFRGTWKKHWPEAWRN